MCNCTKAPIGNYGDSEHLHINWHGATRKTVDTAPEWATALVEADSEGHRQTWWVDNVKSPTKMRLKGSGSSLTRYVDIPNDFVIVHVWQEKHI